MKWKLLLKFKIFNEMEIERWNLQILNGNLPALCEDEDTGDGGPMSEMLESESRLSAPGLRGPDVGDPGDARPSPSSDGDGLLADSGRFEEPDE